jgi:hypothetical protein
VVERKIGLGAFYNAVYKSRGFALAPHHYPIVEGLEDKRIPNLLVLGPPGLGKSNLLCSVYPAWELGHDPSLTVLSISAGEALPQGFMSATMQIIQHDKTFCELFPTVRPDPDLGWSIQRGLYVTGHAPSDPDASYKSVGVASKALTGLHAQLHIYDDMHDRENAYTPESRATLKQTYYNTIMGRADPRGVRAVGAGRWWANDDLYQEWMANGDWVVLLLPASRPGNARLWYDVMVPKGLQCVYTETLEPDPVQDPRSSYVKYKAYYGAVDATKKGFYWPGSPSKRREYETISRRQPRVAAVNYNGDMSGGGDGVFIETDFRPYAPPADMSQGIQSPHIRAWTSSFRNAEIEEAWDTALGQPQSSSLTAALTGLLVPCSRWHRGEDPAVVGECDFHYDVYLLDIMVKDLDFRELAMELRTRFGLWHPRRVIVEEKQSGVSLLQTFKGTQIPVWGQKVEQGKLERAVNPVLAQGMGQPIPGGAASVQGWGRMGRILVPAGAPWLHEPHGDAAAGFIPRVTAFTGGSKMTDEFDALVHLVTRAIVRSRQQAYVPGLDDSNRPEDATAFPAGMPGGIEPMRATMEAFRGLAEQSAGGAVSPFDGMCAAPCKHYAVEMNAERCRKHGTVVSAMHGCMDWAKHA